MSRRFLRPYYVANLLLVVSYAVLRRYLRPQYTAILSKLGGPAAVPQWEMRVAGVLSLALSINGLKAPSVDAMFTDFFLYAEVAIAFLTLLLDWRAAVAYLVVAGLVGAACRQPHFDGPHAIRSLSPPAFLKSVYDSGDALAAPGGPKSKPSDGKYRGPAWLVAFVDPKAPLCIHVEPVLAMLSLKYTSEHLSFGVLNIAAAPALAKHLRIALDPLTSRQLPTLILFDKGQEVGRIPQVDRRTGKVGKGLFRPRDIAGGFDLAAVSSGPAQEAKPAIAVRSPSNKRR